MLRSWALGPIFPLFSLFVSLLYSPFFLLDRFPDHVIDYLTSGHLTLSPLLGFLIVRLFLVRSIVLFFRQVCDPYCS